MATQKKIKAWASLSERGTIGYMNTPFLDVDLSTIAIRKSAILNLKKHLGNRGIKSKIVPCTITINLKGNNEEEI
jgi:hypothetical protein